MCASSIARRGRARSSLNRSSSSTATPTAPSRSRCARLQTTPIPTNVHVADWRDFFPAYLTSAAQSPREHERDAIVPSPLMPHLMAEWLVERAPSRGGLTRSVAVAPVETPVAVPWQRAGADDTYYVSFAEWTCPINCIEPRTCPVTRGPRSWSLPPTRLRRVRGASRHAGTSRAAVMHCRHRTFGVGMFDTAEVLAADAIVRARWRRRRMRRVSRHDLALPRRHHASRHRPARRSKGIPGTARFVDIQDAGLFSPPRNRGRNWPRPINTTSSSSARDRPACAPACTPDAPC